MNRKKAIMGVLLTGVLLMALSFGIKWVIFDTLLEQDDSGRQRISKE
jgi:hypothetical protein